MRLVTFTRGDQIQHLGAFVDGDSAIIDLSAIANRDNSQSDKSFKSMQALIEGGSVALDKVREYIDNPPGYAVLGVKECQLLSPLPRPEQLRCFSVFEEHARESARAMMQMMAAQSDNPEPALEELQKSGRFNIPQIFYERPLYYKGNRFSVVGPDAEILWPSYSQTVDFELELGAVIGLGGRDISREQAADHIFGYTVFNDLSARDEQAREMVAPLGPAKGKDFDGGNVMGPCIVTSDEIPDPYDLVMTASVNGEVWSKNSSSGMTHQFNDMIAYVSRSETIYPGEVFLSGCMGMGSGLELGRQPQRGDRLCMHIEQIGEISNRIL